MGFSTAWCLHVTDRPAQVCHAAEHIRMHPPKTYFVYIMTNRSKTLYTGVTNSLIRRVREHKDGTGSRFAAKYKLDRLVYFERFQDVHDAIEREKRIKGWLRSKKIALIVSVNPAWRDLSLEWYERHAFQPDATTANGTSVPTKATKLSS
jgi:putative endonuclease